jgi:fatty-acid desaturase
MKVVFYFILIFLIGCNSAAEKNAVTWVKDKSIARPIHHVDCETVKDKHGKVNCSVATESVGRLFDYKLKCYNRDWFNPVKTNCVEVVSD